MTVNLTVATQTDIDAINARLAVLEAKIGVTPAPTPTPTPTPAPTPAPGPTTSVAYVGPTRTFKTIKAGFDAITSGGTVMVDPGVYFETFLLNKSCAIKGNGGQAVVALPPNTAPTYGKSILHCVAPHVEFRNIDFKDAMDWQGDASVAAVCTEPGVQTLTLTACNIYHCSQGIRTISEADMESVYPVVTLSKCSIHDCGPGFVPTALAHNVYTMHSGSFTATDSTFGPHTVGHSFKSRMGHNTFWNCVFLSPNARCIDAPEGGTLIVNGGTMTKPAGSADGTYVAWSMENEVHAYGPVTLNGVTFVNDRGTTYITHGPYNAITPMSVLSPIFVGAAPTYSGLVVTS